MNCGSPVKSGFESRIVGLQACDISQKRDQQANFIQKELEKGLKNKNRRLRTIDEENIENLRTELKSHPCHSCKDRESHARIAERFWRLNRENSGLESRMAAKTNVIPRQFNAITKILEERGYIFEDSVTESGKFLAKIYAEMDLVIAESFKAKIFEDVDLFEIPALLSIFLYESRKEAPLRIPSPKFQDKVSEIAKIWLEIHEDELEAAIGQTKELDLGFAWAAFRWAKGSGLSSILNESELSIGDFIRAIKQIMDLLRQLSIAYPEYREKFQTALKSLDKGIIATVTGEL